MNFTALFNIRKNLPATLLLTFVVSWLIYALFPAIGFSKLADIAQASMMIKLSLAAIGLVIYFIYLDFTVTRPWWLLLFPIFLWTLFTYWNYAFTGAVHFNIRVVSIFLFAIPSIILMCQNFKLLWNEVSYFKWFIFFEVLTFLFLMFHSSDFVNPKMEMQYAGASRAFFIGFSYIVLSVVVGYLSFRKHPDPGKLLRQGNTLLIVYIITQTVCTVLGYPFNMFARPIDGFLRGEGFTEHPNSLAGLSSYFFLYLFGIMNYNKRNDIGSAKLPQWFVVAGFVCNGLAFMLALSKNAILSVGLVAVVYALVMAIRFKQRKPLFLLLGLIAMIPIGLILLNLVTGISFTDMIEARAQDSGSFEWRLKAWDALLSELNFKNIWFGKGLGASDEILYSFLSLMYDKNSILNPHNATIQLIYEMGLIGLSYYMMSVAYLKTTFRQTISSPRTLMLSMSGISIMAYFLIAAQGDVMLIAFYTALGWTLISGLDAYIVRFEQDYPDAEETKLLESKEQLAS